MDYAEPPHERQPVTTIAWRMAHMIEVFGPPGAPHFREKPPHRPPLEFVGTAAGALRQLDEGHDSWIEDVRDLGATGLARPQGAISPPVFADEPMAKLVLYTNVEIVHHGAEVCLLRDLYLWRDEQVDR